MGCEVSPVEAGNQRQDLLGRPAPAVDHHEMLMDRFWQHAVQGRFHPPRIQVVLVTRDSHRRHTFLRSVFSALSSLLCLYTRRLAGLRANAPAHSAAAHRAGSGWGAKGGANGHSNRATRGDVWRAVSQADGISGYVRLRPAAGWS